MADIVRMPFRNLPPDEPDPSWSYDMNEVLAELEDALRGYPRSEEDRWAALAVSRLYAPIENDAEAQRALVVNFYGIRQTYREAKLAPGDEGGTDEQR